MEECQAEPAAPHSTGGVEMRQTLTGMEVSRMCSKLRSMSLNVSLLYFHLNMSMLEHNKQPGYSRLTQTVAP